MAIKIDLQKAYDRFNWKFIHAIPINLGFNTMFINWILAYINYVSFEALVNGGKIERFNPSRGLRQGDPLSPYLFILGQEVLSRFLERELGAGNISGTKPCARGPTITHVMYADDIILFSKATRNDAQRLADCLEKYCLWSGQSINKSKSSIFFSKHTGPCCRRTIKQILELKSLKKDAVYLGAPMFLSRSPSKDFKFLIDKVEAKLTGWRSRCLSWAGRCTLIN